MIGLQFRRRTATPTSPGEGAAARSSASPGGRVNEAMTSPRSAPLPCGAPLIEGGVLIARCDQPPHHPGITQRTPSGGTVVSFVGQHGNTDGVPIFWTDQPRQVEP